jgi:CSLREA domain-containing protein
MISKTPGHNQVTCGFLVIPRITYLFLIAALAISLVGSLTISAPALEVAASPTTLTVTKLADTNDGACDADCSLREALAAAAPNDTVDFPSGLTGTINLGSTLTINKTVVINGPSTKSIIISGKNTVRVFYVESGGDLTIKNLTVSNGRIKGIHGSDGEPLKHGTGGGAAAGGGLFNDGGTVTIINSTFSNNEAIGGTGGAGGRLPSRGYALGGTGGYAAGGALSNNRGFVKIINSTFSGNRVTGGARGLGGQDGDGLVSAGGDGMGGALFSTGTVIVVNSTFSDNRTRGGVGGEAGHGGSGGNGMGGALFSTGTSFLVNSTFSENSAIGGGGVAGLGSGKGGSGGNGLGGAIHSSYLAEVSNCTFADNSASGGSGGLVGNYFWGNADGGAPGISSGGAIYRPGAFPVKKTLTVNRSGAITLRNTLIANSSSGGNCEASLLSEGFNLDTDGTCGLAAPGDLSKVSPRLGPLTQNGGNTFTHALLPNSPAIDGGNPTGCTDHTGTAIATDQRGRNRTGRCDIGAFELSP